MGPPAIRARLASTQKTTYLTRDEDLVIHGVNDHEVEKNIQRAKASYAVYEQAKEATRAYGEAYHTRFW